MKVSGTATRKRESQLQYWCSATRSCARREDAQDCDKSCLDDDHEEVSLCQSASPITQDIPCTIHSLPKRGEPKVCIERCTKSSLNIPLATIASAKLSTGARSSLPSI